MIQGRGYTVGISGLSTGITDDAELIVLTAATDKPIAIGAIQGHFTNGDSAENVSFTLVRCNTVVGGSSVTPRPNNPDDTAAGFTCVTGPTSLVRSPTDIIASFGGNGAANYGWYASMEEHQIILKPADSVVVVVATAPTSALTMRATLSVTEL
jgi:hypothetical protein